MNEDIYFVGDPHGHFRHFMPAIERDQPAAVVLLGDVEAEQPLGEIMAKWDYARLWEMQADILVTHEVPSCHRHGFRELDDLGAALGVGRHFHGITTRPTLTKLLRAATRFTGLIWPRSLMTRARLCSRGCRHRAGDDGSDMGTISIESGKGDDAAQRVRDID